MARKKIKKQRRGESKTRQDNNKKRRKQTSQEKKEKERNKKTKNKLNKLNKQVKNSKFTKQKDRKKKKKKIVSHVSAPKGTVRPRTANQRQVSTHPQRPHDVQTRLPGCLMMHLTTPTCRVSGYSARADQHNTHVVDVGCALRQRLGDADEAGEGVDVEELVGCGQPLDLERQLVLGVLGQQIHTLSEGLVHLA